MNLISGFKYSLISLLIAALLTPLYTDSAKSSSSASTLNHCANVPIVFKDKADANFGEVSGNTGGGDASISAYGLTQYSNNLFSRGKAIAGQITFEAAPGCRVEIACPDEVILSNGSNHSLLANGIEIAVQQANTFIEPITCKGMEQKALALQIPSQGSSESTVYIGASVHINDRITNGSHYSSRNKGGSSFKLNVTYAKN